MKRNILLTAAFLALNAGAASADNRPSSSDETANSTPAVQVTDETAKARGKYHSRVGSQGNTSASERSETEPRTTAPYGGEIKKGMSGGRQ
jgi:hypothetical protein